MRKGIVRGLASLGRRSGLVEGMSVIVTGAGGGLGAGIAKVLVREGAKVVLGDIDGAAAKKLEDYCGREHVVACEADVSTEEGRKLLIETCLDSFGGLDGLVNNAGRDFSKPLLETTEKDWDDIVNLNLRSSFLLTRDVTRKMMENSFGADVEGTDDAQIPSKVEALDDNDGKWDRTVSPRQKGAIVHISSVHALAGMAGAGPYDASKAGMVGMARAHAVEFARHGIRCNVVAPGLCATQIWEDILKTTKLSKRECWEQWSTTIPLGRPSTPGEIGEAAAFLLSPRASSVVGTLLTVDGGMTAQLVPNF